jgi:hypothetical protein
MMHVKSIEGHDGGRDCRDDMIVAIFFVYVISVVVAKPISREIYQDPGRVADKWIHHTSTIYFSSTTRKR